MNKKINIILYRSVKHLGPGGKVVKVSAGYFNNYLGPQKIAVRYTDHMFQTIQKKETENKENKIAFYDKQKELLFNKKDKHNKPSVEFEVNVGNHGLLYGSITADKIAKAFNDKYKTSINKKHILLDHKIKTISDDPYVIQLDIDNDFIDAHVYVLRNQEKR